MPTDRPLCIIDLPSHVGTPATWRSRSHPTMTVCDRHADQYAEAYDDDTRVDDWEPIETVGNGSTPNPCEHHSWRVEGDDNYEPYHLICEDCGERQECVPTEQSGRSDA